MDALGLVLIGGRDDLDDLVARELERGDVHGATVHQVGIQYAQHALVCDDEEVALLALQLENDRLKAYSEVVIGLVRE